MPNEAESIRRADELRVAIERARLGDGSAFTDLVAALHPLVYRWSLTFSRDAEEAEEITQETFILIYRKLAQYRGESSFESWVYLITRRVGLQGRRKAKRREFLSALEFPGMETVYTTDPGARVDRQRIASYIKHFFQSLPPRQREVFDLVDLQGLSPTEVAELTGAKPAVVRANLFKARASIRAHVLETHPSWTEIDR